MAIAVKVESLSKHFMLGQTFEHTLSSRIGNLLRGRNMLRRAPRQEEFWALRDLSFEINEGEAVGIIGANGAGKSTLLKILSRITPPTSGRALVRGRLASLLEVGTGFHPELTGRENVFLNGAILGMRKSEVARKFDEIVAFSGVEKFIDTPVKRYSSGMYVRLAFAVAAHLEPDVLIIDEVLAVGDVEFQKRCLGKMGDVARDGRTVVFVSHNMASIQKLCSRAIWLKSGQVQELGAPAEIIGAYLEDANSVAGRSDSLRAGFLFEDSDPLPASQSARIHGIELLDEAGQPLADVRTWQAITLRIHFEVTQPQRAFSAVLQISTPDGVVLLLTSTTPDHAVAFSVDQGRYFVDCAFEHFPLAAGEYLLGAGLAIPGVEHVWRSESLARLQVAPVDTFNSGLPPSSNRYLVATRHVWRFPVSAGPSKDLAVADA